MKPYITKGTRDFGTVEMNRRNYIFNTISKIFRLYGYQSIETPAIENLSTLTGKYGNDGDKLMFRILNSGDFLNNVNTTNNDYNKILPLISEKGLRYDLTVPFARFVAMHQNEITFPFRRYQIQPVWRADRPQKGRYREFYQCDVDIVGSNSLLNEFELIQIVDDIFKKLNVSVKIKINNRKILAGLSEYIGSPEKLLDITTAIDKIEKIGVENVLLELSEKGFCIDELSKLKSIFDLFISTIDNRSKLEQIKIILTTDIAKKGVEEIEELLTYADNLKINTEIEFDITLARGLNYYTGCIFEVKAIDIEIGSLCGGGRYDDLTKLFDLDGISGVGISFGADRIYDVINQLKLFPVDIEKTTDVLFLNFGKTEELFCLSLLSKLRSNNISAEIYPDNIKIKKQLSYADKKNVKYVVIIGESEIQTGNITIKNLETRTQVIVNIDNLIEFFISK